MEDIYLTENIDSVDRRNNTKEKCTSEEMNQMIDQVLEGIVQKITVIMDQQQITIRGLGEMADVSYVHLSRMFNRQTRIGLTTLIKVAYALHISPCDLFPYDINKRKTNGQRFDEITRDIDVKKRNFLLTICVDYVREWRRIKRF